MRVLCIPPSLAAANRCVRDLVLDRTGPRYDELAVRSNGTRYAVQSPSSPRVDARLV